MHWGFSLSVLAEISQFVFKLGIFEVDDIIANTIGTCIGVFITVLAKKITWKIKTD